MGSQGLAQATERPSASWLDMTQKSSPSLKHRSGVTLHSDGSCAASDAVGGNGDTKLLCRVRPQGSVTAFLHVTCMEHSQKIVP